MSKKVIIIIVMVAIVVGINIYVAFYFMPYQKALEIVINAAGRDRTIIESFDKGFVIAAAKAIKSGKDTFEFNNKTYVTSSLKSQV